MAKALCLALGAIHAVRHIQSLKREVALGGNLNLGLQGEIALRQQVGRDGQARVVGRNMQYSSVQPGPDQAQPLAIQPQIVPLAPRRVGLQLKPRQHPCGFGGKAKGQMHRRHPMGVGLVIGQIDGLGAFGVHQVYPSGRLRRHPSKGHRLCARAANLPKVSRPFSSA